MGDRVGVAGIPVPFGGVRCAGSGNGGRNRIRTYDPLIKSQLLYQLSYAPGSGDAR